MQNKRAAVDVASADSSQRINSNACVLKL